MLQAPHTGIAKETTESYHC